MTHAAPVSPVDRAGLRQRVDKALTGFLTTQRGWLTGVDEALVPVAEAVEAFVLRGGKRLRPAFGYWGYRGAGGVDSDQVVATLAALEFVQASALIHDDLMDRSDTRRGEPAVHRRFASRHRASGWTGDAEGFGDAAAILLGDLCLVWSDEMLHSAGLDARTLARARPVFDEMRTEVTVGQYLDVLTQATGDTSLERAGKVARYKSAKYTVERPLLLGAALAGATAEVEATYSAYGLPLGEAFQLRDDVLGVFGDPAQTGKPAGDDLREGKRTYLVAAAVAGTDDAGRALIDRHLGDPGLDGAGVARLREVITASGALARTEERIAALTDTALAALATVDLETEARQALVDLAIAATRRAD
ncbi:polyprenyl synthetase family protein [Micromonospora sagamiensis]|uniref:Geranylgeranyl diphosphate synthase type I n=1 Tax=Micromonospora sagamiensis TaxID=47875 RepID=A0A562WCV3_9ACTN|nr:polyprenyl synthetase family protein [Micromonospora sagamiensis]TWJ28113.1 geranylgeranyl diphosphate synthase type I [Micromonospora sagamiensis]BCL12998.1 geranylgeranyl pyrophosphate synthase [Micromonospora sagamiensis]